MNTDYYSVKWSTNAALTKTKLPQVISFIPLLGYAVLWGDQFQQFIMRFHSLGEDRFFTPIQRVELLYAGGVLVLAGLVMFYLFCPTVIRDWKTRSEYIHHVFDTADYRELSRVQSALSKLIAKQPKEGGDMYFDEFPASSLNTAAGMLGTHTHKENLVIGKSRRELVYPGLSAYFEMLDRSRWFLSLLSFLLMTSGALLFLAPSIEVFLMVLGRLFRAAGLVS